MILCPTTPLRRTIRIAFFACVPMPLGVARTGDAVPFPDALDAAAISVERLDSVHDDALLLGNGDVNALLYSSQTELRMMLTKNDVGDARLITENDPPLPKFRWLKRLAPDLSPGGRTEIHEDGFRTTQRDGDHDYPYPFPKPCAQLVFGNDDGSRSWRIARAGGSLNAFLAQDDGAIMRIAGEAGCSNGYAISLKGLDLSKAARLRIQLSGTPNARFFIDVLNETGANERFGLRTGWIDSPAEDTVHEFELTQPEKHERLILYTWSTDGKLAENHVRRIPFEDSSGAKDFERNRDSTFDIAMFRFVFKAAIEGATLMGRDDELISRWKDCLKKLPDYPTTSDDEPVVVDVRDAPPTTYNIAIPAVPVFPGDHVTRFSSDEQRSLLARSIDWLKWNGNNSSIIVSVARARLSMPHAADFMRATFRDRLKPNGTLGLNKVGTRINQHGHYTEQFAATMAVSELLLQSVGDIIRVFPAWPKEMDARFADLRAQGGFLVTAEQRSGEVVRLEITSTVGGTLRLLSPWPTIKVRTQSGTETLKADSRDEMRFIGEYPIA